MVPRGFLNDDVKHCFKRNYWFFFIKFPIVSKIWLNHQNNRQLLICAPWRGENSYGCRLLSAGAHVPGHMHEGRENHPTTTNRCAYTCQPFAFRILNYNVSYNWCDYTIFDLSSGFANCLSEKGEIYDELKHCWLQSRQVRLHLS